MTTAASSGILTQLLTLILRLITLILRLLVFPLAKLSRVIFPPKPFDNVQAGEKAARAFVTQFGSFLPSPVGEGGSGNDAGGSDEGSLECMNPLEVSSYSSVVSEAHQSNRFVMVYLHSPLNPDSKHFIQYGLADARVLSFLNSRRAAGNLLVWGGSVHSADGAALARALNVCSYPFVALLSCQRSSSSADLFLRLEGLQKRQTGNNARTSSRRAVLASQIPFQPTDFLSIMAAHLMAYQNILDEAMTRQRIREEEAALRAEQDREFQETLEADRRREEERAEAERQEQRRVEEEREKLRIEEEKRERILEEAKKLVSEEPPSGPGVARIRLFLPSGSKVQRRFLANDKVEVIRAYVRLYFDENNIDIENFELSSNYPKKILANDSESIQDALGGLQAVIMIRDLDA